MIRQSNILAGYFVTVKISLYEKDETETKAKAKAKTIIKH